MGDTSASEVWVGERTPLAEIEHLVQARAKDRSFDVRDAGGSAALRSLVDEEIAAWRADYSRGLRPFDLTDPASVADRAYRNLAGYGPLEPLLADDDVWEICVNAPDAIFVKRHRGLSGYHDEVFHDDEHVLRTLTKLLDDAGGAHRKLDPAEGPPRHRASRGDQQLSGAGPRPVSDVQSESPHGGTVTTLAEHLSSFLGGPSGGDRVLLDRAGRSISLLRYNGFPCEGAATVVTNGLSELPHHRLHEELLLACWTPELSTDLLLVVEFVARQLAEGREPLAYGDVIGPAGPLVPGSRMEALYVCEPTYFPEGFAAFNSPDGCRVRLRWLVPIHASEARIIEQKGAEFFEELLVGQDPDLLSLDRPPVDPS